MATLPVLALSVATTLAQHEPGGGSTIQLGDAATANVRGVSSSGGARPTIRRPAPSRAASTRPVRRARPVGPGRPSMDAEDYNEQG
ncbi:MAG TPA: hypothetical protein VGB17_09885, partial [Pyrinomonadaceae bacterium]